MLSLKPNKKAVSVCFVGHTNKKKIPPSHFAFPPLLFYLSEQKWLKQTEVQRQFYFPHGGRRQRPRRRPCHDSASPQPCLRNSLQDVGRNASYSHNTNYKPNLHVMWLVSWDPHLIFGLKLMNCVLSLEFPDKKIITGRVTSYCRVESRNWLHSAWLMVSCASLLPCFLISFISFPSFQSLFLYLPNHCFVQLPSSSPLTPPLSSSSSPSLCDILLLCQAS